MAFWAYERDKPTYVTPKVLSYLLLSHYHMANFRPVPSACSEELTHAQTEVSPSLCFSS
jgi:hypothetical protein